jgi:hypothetical protein
MAGIDEDYNGYCWGAHTGDAGVLVDWEYRCVTYNWDAIVTGVSECPPNGFVQAETFDTYLDRVLLANYFNLHKGITLWGPHSFYNARGLDLYFLGSPESGKSTEVWPLFSLEYPLLGQLACLSPSKEVSCHSQFLGLALDTLEIFDDGTNYCLQDDNGDGVSDTIWVWPGKGMGLSLRNVEDIWLNGFHYFKDTLTFNDVSIFYWNNAWHNGYSYHHSPQDYFTNNPAFWNPPNPAFNSQLMNYLDSLYHLFAQSYTENISPYHPSLNPLGNKYTGFMYYTYSIIKCKGSVYKKAPAQIPDHHEKIRTYVIGKETNLSIPLEESDVTSYWQILGLLGHKWAEGYLPSGTQYYSFPFNNLAAGVYFLNIVSGGLNSFPLIKVIIQ